MAKHEASGRPLLRFEDIPLELSDLRLTVRQTSEVLRRFEVEYLTTMLHDAGSVSEAARRAKVDRKHFWRMMQRNGLLRR